MLEFLAKVKQYLWDAVEIGFLSVLVLLLAYLLLGEAAGPYVASVFANVMQFATAVPTPTLVGLAIVIALVYFFAHRMR